MEIFRDFNLKPFNTFHVPARAARMARFKNVEELRALLNDPDLKDLPRLVLGGGSNVLFTQDWPGVVLLNEIGG
ncbi:MAG TPA: UDP-N-acetylenolpyruvoylglucosamine reductase, partial [Flavobacteriales bacterium]|nr:UDP-N-acetylenolpyruvoylglucosamine reductase [Flavobacteriales bacterium]HRP83043.1 UDP-N-acetylenolpyruvoylglucosamine reductase [Flavobacteriales bacterium]